MLKSVVSGSVIITMGKNLRVKYRLGRKMSNRRNRRFLTGFTLIEVMLSVAVLALGFVLILQGFAYSLNTLRISENNLATSLLAEIKMDEMQIEAKQGGDVLLGSSSDKVLSDNIEFYWKTKVTPYEEDEELNIAEAALSWKEGKRKGVFILATYLRIPSDKFAYGQ